MINKKLLVLLILSAGFLFNGCKKNNDEPENKIDIPEGYQLEWSDEFDGNGIDATNWNFETGDGTDYGLPPGWGNDEKQIYTSDSENAGIVTHEGQSVLAITAREDGAGGYTSARLTTQDNLTVRFGRLEIRAKLPEGKGLWPAIWLLGANIDQIDWPGCGEIDIIEVLGNEPEVGYSTVHYVNGVQEKGEQQYEHQLPSGKFSDSFHTFMLDWTPESVTFGIDGKMVHTITIEDDMKEFLRGFYLVMNVAVGGNWPGDPDASTVFPQILYVDYVRLFSKEGFEAPEAPALDVAEETIGQVIDPSVGQHAIRDDFTDLGNLEVIAWGGGGEPDISASATAIDGDSSLVFDFPGGNWGGAYLELESAADLSQYAFLKFSLHKPESLVNAEIKLESPSTNATLFLEAYNGSPVGEGFMEYTIPLGDFQGLDLTEITIPFAMWNPQDASQNFVTANVLIDNVYFSN
ncbi:MAG: glycoside hydrolase family 16 protein [bacterium]